MTAVDRPALHPPFAHQPDQASGGPPAVSPRRGSRRWLRALAPAGALAPFAAAAVFVLHFNPTDHVADPTGPCPWHAATGINGPSCGGTRMFYHLLHGDVVDAARHHLPALIAVPFLIYAWARWALGTWFGVRLPGLRFGWKTYLAYGVFWVLFTTVLRNLAWGPFDWFDIPNLDMP